jgi:hypothetical protein
MQACGVCPCSFAKGWDSLSSLVDVLAAVLLVAALACSSRRSLGRRRWISVPLLSLQRRWPIFVQRLDSSRWVLWAMALVAFPRLGADLQDRRWSSPCSDARRCWRRAGARTSKEGSGLGCNSLIFQGPWCKMGMYCSLLLIYPSLSPKKNWKFNVA